MAKEGAAKFHFLDYAPPTFMIFRDQIALQMTLRNTIQFGPAKGSIYKRAAQSFDLFLAPQLRDLSDRISPDLEFQLFDFSVLNKLSPARKALPKRLNLSVRELLSSNSSTPRLRTSNYSIRVSSW